MNAFSDFTLAEWIHYLENRHDQEIQLGLERVKKIATQLNLQPVDTQVITVTGTNGKGSTVAALVAIYTAAGYQVASYTSPHLWAFNERICVNTQPISDENLCAAFTAISQECGDIKPTYFEMTTLAALWYFKQFKLDIIILEVGLGGRLDATNIVDADLAIITTIDLDHQEYLGNTKEAIGYEKAGILRSGIPFIYADTSPPESIINQALLLNTKMFCLGENFSFQTSEDSLQIILENKELAKLPLPKLNTKAATAAIMASFSLNAVLPVTPGHWKNAMETVSIAGRQQVLQGVVTTLFDVAHNPQAVSLLVDFIQNLQPQGSVHAIFSALKDKNLCGLINPMRFCVDFWYPAVLSGKRASSKSLLMTAFKEALNIEPVCFESPSHAYRGAIQQAMPGDLIVVYGSFLTVSAVMAAESNPNKQEVLQ